MGPQRRAELAVELSEDVRLVTLDGLRARHPDADERELGILLVELWHGRALAESVRTASL
jgi:hypothetical protein